jgi:hypothetical protein
LYQPGKACLKAAAEPEPEVLRTLFQILRIAPRIVVELYIGGDR